MKFNIMKYLNQPIVFLYRTVSIVVLYAVLLGVGAYAARLGFYAVSRTYIVPVVLSSSDAEALDLTQKVVVSAATRDDLTLDIGKLQASAVEMEHHRQSLQALEPSLEAAIRRETLHDAANGTVLAALNDTKVTDNTKTDRIMRDVEQTAQGIDTEIAAGLLTKQDGAVAKATLNQMSSSATDSKIAEVLLRDDVLAKNTKNTTRIDTLDKLAELQSEISQLDIALVVARRQIEIEGGQIRKLNTALEAASRTPYSVVGEKTVVAFVPYKSAGGIKEGSRVVACDLDFVWCHETGKVVRIFTTEEQRTDPVFKLTIRGFMVEITATDTDAKNDTLFLGGKPVWF